MPQLPLGLDTPCGWHRCDFTAGHDAETYGWHHRDQELFKMDERFRRFKGVPEWQYYCNQQGCTTFVFEPGQRTCEACKPLVKLELHRTIRRDYARSRLSRPRRIV